MDCGVICDVVAIVAQGRGKEWHEPNRVDPKFLEVIELLLQPFKITDAIPVAVVESAHVHLIDDRVLVPKHILVQWQTHLLGIISMALGGAPQNASLYEVTTSGIS